MSSVQHELIELARRHAVAVWLGGRFRGSGFLITPELVVTCAHVVVGGQGDFSVQCGDRTVSATVEARIPVDERSGEFHEFPDIGLLRLEESLDADGVWFSPRPPVAGTQVYAMGFSESTPARGVAADSLDLRLGGLAAGFLKVNDDRIVEGLSRALVLDVGSGRVCGMIKASRHKNLVQGGWIVPVDAIVEHLGPLVPGLGGQHKAGTAWFDLASGRAALTTALLGSDDPVVALPPPSDPRPAWWLEAPNQIVPFHERPELKDLWDWCCRREGRGVRTVTAAGGAGKTRLAIELCRRLRECGWIAGFLPLDRSGDAGRATQAMADAAAATRVAAKAGYRVLLVIDYAEAYARQVDELIRGLGRPLLADGPVRLLLLARSSGPWWKTLSGNFDSFVEPGPLALPPLATSGEPADVANAAWVSFHQAVLQSSAPELPDHLVPADTREDALITHARVLDEVLMCRPGADVRRGAAARDPLRRILAHEWVYWRAIASQNGIVYIFGEHDALLRRDLLVPSLIPTADRPQAESVLGDAAEHLRHLYPGEGTFWAPLQPDRLAETLLLDVFEEAHDAQYADDVDGTVRVMELFARLLAPCTVPQTEQALRFMYRAALSDPTRWRMKAGDGDSETVGWGDRIEALAGELVYKRPYLSAPAAVRALPWVFDEYEQVAADLVTASDAALLRAILANLPETHRVLQEFAVSLAQALVRREPLPGRYLPWFGHRRERALRAMGALNELSRRLTIADEPLLAVTAARQAARAARRLSRASASAGHAFELGDSLDILVERELAVDEWERARRAARRAARAWNRLAKKAPRTRLMLANALARCAQLRPDSARDRKQRWRDLREAAAVSKQLWNEDHEHFHRTYANILNLASKYFAAQGNFQQALDTARQSVAVTEHEDAVPNEDLPAYADQLHNLAGLYAKYGFQADALARTRQCADVLRQLVDEQPTRYFTAYSMTLANLAELLRRNGDEQEAAGVERDRKSFARTVDNAVFAIGGLPHGMEPPLETLMSLAGAVQSGAGGFIEYEGDHQNGFYFAFPQKQKDLSPAPESGA